MRQTHCFQGNFQLCALVTKTELCSIWHPLQMTVTYSRVACYPRQWDLSHFHSVANTIHFLSLPTQNRKGIRCYNVLELLEYLQVIWLRKTNLVEIIFCFLCEHIFTQINSSLLHWYKEHIFCSVFQIQFKEFILKTNDVRSQVWKLKHCIKIKHNCAIKAKFYI